MRLPIRIASRPTIVAAAAVLACLAPLPVAVASPGARATDGVWVNGHVERLVTAPGPAGATHATPLYVIAPVAIKHPLHSAADAETHGFGAHDHVIQLPSKSSSFTGPCELTLVVPGTKATRQSIRARSTMTPAGRRPLLYTARLGGRIASLTWASRIRRAVQLGLARTIDTHTTLTCTVSRA